MITSDSMPVPKFIDDDAENPKLSSFEVDDSDNSTKLANIVSIEVPVFVDGDIADAKISNFEVVASYNWLDELTPTILVPGE